MHPTRALFLALVVAVLVIGFVPGFSSGPFSGLSGAPGDDTCVLCHGSFGLNDGIAAGIATFGISAPDTTVGLTTVPVGVGFPTSTRSTHGFQVTARDATGTTGTLGFPGAFTLTDPVATTYAFFGSDPTYVTHTSSGVAQQNWSVDWAPDTNTPAGPITFYAAGNAANGNGSPSGDYIFTATHKVYQAAVSAPATAAPASLHPISLLAPGQPFGAYVLAISEDSTDVPVAPGLEVTVNPFTDFALFALSEPSLFQNFIGILDAGGAASAAALVPVYPPALSGFQFHLGFAIFDATQLPALSFVEVSNQATFSLQ